MFEKRLEIFFAVAMTRNFGKAAELLNVTPSSISKELKNLEDDLGMLLVDRQKGVKVNKLTPAGESFLPLVLKWQEINREIQNARKKREIYFLSIGGCEVANNNLLPDVFNELLNHAPAVLLKILTDPTDQLYEKVETRDIDVAFVVHPEASRLVQITPMLRDEMLIARYYEGDGKLDEIGTIDPNDLDTMDELYVEWSHEYRLWHHAIWDPDKPLRAELITAYLLPFMLDRPKRWSIVPKCIMPSYKKMERNIKFYRLTTPPPPLVFYQVTHRNPKLSALNGLGILHEILQKKGFFNI